MSEGQEEWRNIRDTNGEYQVSDWGRIKSVGRVIMRKDGTPYPVREKILRMPKNGPGYLAVILYQSRMLLIHRIVVETFIGAIPPGHYVHHMNYIKTDNRLSNLAVVSPGENTQDARERGVLKAPYGEAAGRAILTEEVVMQMREEYIPHDRTHGSRALGRRFGVSSATARLAITGQTWRHLLPAVSQELDAASPFAT